MKLNEYLDILKKYGIQGINLTNDLSKELEDEDKMELKNEYKIELTEVIEVIKNLNSVITNILNDDTIKATEKLYKINATNEVIRALLKPYFI